jgi:hypothetical protein
MTNSAIWELLTPLQAEALEELAERSNVRYQHTMAAIQLYVLEGMDINQAIDDVIGEII